MILLSMLMAINNKGYKEIALKHDKPTKNQPVQLKIFPFSKLEEVSKFIS